MSENYEISENSDFYILTNFSLEKISKETKKAVFAKEFWLPKNYFLTPILVYKM